MSYDGAFGPGGAPGGGLPAGSQPGDILIFDGTNWVLSQGSPEVSQHDWWVDSVFGSNLSNGDGPGADALQTLTELDRRLRGRQARTGLTINLNGTWSEFLTLDVFVPPGQMVEVIGATNVVDGGTLTAAFVAYAAATNVDAKVTDAAQVWAPLLRQTILMTSGVANGANTHVMKDLGANVARVGQFVLPTGAAATPVNGDSYSITNPAAQFGGFDVLIHGGGDFKCTDTRTLKLATSGGSRIQTGGIDSGFTIGRASLIRHEFAHLDVLGNDHWYDTDVDLVGCNVFYTTQLKFFRCKVSLFGVVNFGYLTAQAVTMIGVARLSVAQGAADVFGWAAFNNSSIVMIDSLGVYDQPAGASIELDTRSEINEFAGHIFGSGNTNATGLRIRPGSAANVANIPVMTGATAQNNVGGVDTPNAALPWFNPANGAAVSMRVSP